MRRRRRRRRSTLTDELYGLREETREVLAPVIADWYLHVLYGAVSLENVRQIRGYVQNVLYPVASERLAVLAVGRVSQVQVRQYFHREVFVFLGTC